MANIQSNEGLILNSSNSTSANYGIREYRFFKSINSAGYVNCFSFNIISTPGAQVALGIMMYSFGSWATGSVNHQHNVKGIEGHFWINTSGTFTQNNVQVWAALGDGVSNADISPQSNVLYIRGSGTPVDMNFIVKAMCTDWSRLSVSYY